MVPEKQIYVLIPVHNRKVLTLSCLQNLTEFILDKKFKIVVIDDGSTDGTTEAIENRFNDVKVLEGDGSLWWTGAIALGMHYAIEQGADYIFSLNDDCQFGPGTLDALLEFCQSHPRTIVGAQGFSQEDHNKLTFGGKRKTWKGYRFIQAPLEEIIPCDLLSGNIVCYPRALIQEIGYPDPSMTPHYGGDSLYLIRAQKAGFDLYVDGRFPAYDFPGEPQLYPNNWLFCDGEPNRLIKLMFNPYSGLSWRVWLRINWEAYSCWGIIMFLKKYISIMIISSLRYILFYLSKRNRKN